MARENRERGDDIWQERTENGEMAGDSREWKWKKRGEAREIGEGSGKGECSGKGN